MSYIGRFLCKLAVLHVELCVLYTVMTENNGANGDFPMYRIPGNFCGM